MPKVITRAHAQWVHDMVRARVGLPYGYGGAFTNDPKRSTDCSGLVLQTAAWYMGRTDWVGNRYGSTESFRLDYKIIYDLGFKRMPPGGPAALPFKPVMLVGLQHGGGGVYSHTACTLMTMDYPGGPVVQSARGVDWESHGNRNGRGIDLYDGARAWNDPMFHDFWYLDAVLEGGADAGPDAVDVLARATGLSLDRARVIYPTVRDGLIASECAGNANRIAMWLAQVGHESANFNATAEYASGDAYDTRTDLGNTPQVDGDGRLYKGRTWIQITGKNNYRQFSEWAHGKGLVPTPDYFVVHPLELSDLRWAGIGAAWYWTVARGTRINEGSDRRDLVGVTHLINGGTNGLYEAGGRQDRYNRALALGNQLLALTNAGDDMASVPQDQWDRVFRELTQSHESLSGYRTPNEGFVGTWCTVDRNKDLMLHEIFVEWNAIQFGDIDAIYRILRSSVGLGANTSVEFITKSKRALSKIPTNYLEPALAAIEAEDPDVLRAFISQNGSK